MEEIRIAVKYGIVLIQLVLLIFQIIEARKQYIDTDKTKILATIIVILAIINIII